MQDETGPRKDAEEPTTTLTRTLSSGLRPAWLGHRSRPLQEVGHPCPRQAALWTPGNTVACPLPGRGWGLSPVTARRSNKASRHKDAVREGAGPGMPGGATEVQLGAAEPPLRPCPGTQPSRVPWGWGQRAPGARGPGHPARGSQLWEWHADGQGGP